MATPESPNPAVAKGGVATTVVLTLLWYVSSMLAITTSKMTMEALRVPLVLCTGQFATATFISFVVARCQGQQTRLTGEEGGAMWAVAVTYTLGFFLTNLAFSLANAPFVETVKAGEPISTVVLAFVLLGEREAFTTYASLLPLVLGVGMASSGEAGGSLSAFAATLGSNFGFSARAVFAKQLKVDHPKSPAAVSDTCLFFHISMMGLCALLPLALINELDQFQTEFFSFSFPQKRFLYVMLLNGIMYTGYNQFSFMVLSRVSTATHAVLNVCRRVCVIGVTTFFFGTPLSMVNMVGVLIAVLGMFWFTHAKSTATAKKTK